MEGVLSEECGTAGGKQVGESPSGQELGDLSPPVPKLAVTFKQGVVLLIVGGNSDEEGHVSN